MKPLGSSLCAYILLAQAVSSLPDLLGHPSLQDIYLTLPIMVACFVVLYCDCFFRYNLQLGILIETVAVGDAPHVLAASESSV